ncbi:sigma-70 family RNA polymerase sigma factor [Rhizobium deserti]|uniref:Sigma-70 family RNA polymerase sigma factor n=1 Tax=Rhizobium deserti TaxID=2547961 RepID=A0A4R5UB36_9HYPH|nr:sigma-70 family RNA polymerase sigma factor [Rhizobium deserti]TDK32136.1 sigma-70 family RNA polymerase sigma factor [Rhizobium deserti]
MDAHSQQGQLEKEVVQLVPELRRFARRFHSASYDIDDLVQETVLKALANAEKFQPGTRLKSWMFTIMRNIFCTKFGLQKREQVGFEDDVAGSRSVNAAQEWSVRGHELEKAIGQLPDPYRLALKMVFIDGVSYEEAAKRCKCPVGTVKSRVNRARQQLAKQLNDEDD